MTTSEQLERQAELTRAQIADSLAELRDRMTPGNVVDEALDYVRGGQMGKFVRNLGHQMVENPIPVALIGAGLGWLMLANRAPRSEAVLSAASQMRDDRTSSAVGSARQSADRAARETSAWVKDTTSGIGDASREAGSQLKDAARGTGAALSDAASSLYEGAEQAYGSAADRARDMGRSASALGANALGGSRNLAAFLRDEPLVLAGIGLTLGAVLGAALQITETEKELMGKASNAVKEGVGEAAEETWQKGKAAAAEAADNTWEDLKRSVEDKGLTAGTVGPGDHSAAAEHAPPAANQWTDAQPKLVPEQDAGSRKAPKATERKILPG